MSPIIVSGRHPALVARFRSFIAGMTMIAVRLPWHGTVRVVFVILSIVIGTAVTRAQQTDDPEALNQQFFQLLRAARYPKATGIAQRALAATVRQFGPDDTKVGTALHNLAEVYRVQGRNAEAEPLYKRALTIAEKAVTNLGSYLRNLPERYVAQLRNAVAEPLMKLDLTIAERGLGPDHPIVGALVSNLADLYVTQSRYAEAEPLMKRALAIVVKVFGPDHPRVSTRLNNLALLYDAQGRYSEAEPLHKRALAIDEKALGPDDPEVGAGLNNLAGLYHTQGRYAEAEPLYKRAIAIAEKARGPDHPDVGTDLNNLAMVYQAQGRYAEAEPLFKRALAIDEKALGPYDPDVGTDLNNLGDLYRARGRYAEAEPLLKRALAIEETTLGADHQDVGTDLNNLAMVYQAQGRYAEAEALYKRALAIAEKGLGPDHPWVSIRLNNLAALYFSQGDWVSATDFLRRGTAVIVRRTMHGAQNIGQTMTGKRTSENLQSSLAFSLAIKAATRLPSEHRNDTGLSREMFQNAQWAQNSEAAMSLAQMAARGAKGDPELAVFVRERQDLVAEWQRRDQARSAALAQAADRGKREAEANNVSRLAAIDARIAIIDRMLAAKFPDYAALASPAPLSVEDVQAQLASDEALVVFLDTPEFRPTPEETFIWVVTKTHARWARSKLGTQALIREVSALRCGLDYQSWTGSRCSDLLKIAYTRADHDTFDKPLPFDLRRAHELYKELFGQIEELIKDKRLLIVPSGPLTQLPFQVLVTEPPKLAIPSNFLGYRDVDWLARKHAITVLPAVSSLKALRELAKESHANEPYIGFGDPLLDGDPEKYPGDTERAKLAREKRCELTLRPPRASLLSLGGGARAMTHGDVIADVADIRRWEPLPETADELCEVAHDLGVDPTTHVYLGATATETKVNQLSEEGSLAKYKIVHFATHGAVAGEVSRASEPGLLLTPPEEANQTDDGYLSASEIAALKLDADWVILSACNTAAGEATGAEALSGLARAFFYAGARSLLVSHWEVSSDSTVKLITKTIAELKADSTIGRADALRRSMLSMVDTGKEYEAHPAFWAPFVLVGEGGAAR